MRMSSPSETSPCKQTKQTNSPSSPSSDSASPCTCSSTSTASSGCNPRASRMLLMLLCTRCTSSAFEPPLVSGYPMPVPCQKKGPIICKKKAEGIMLAHSTHCRRHTFVFKGKGLETPNSFCLLYPRRLVRLISLFECRLD